MFLDDIFYFSNINSKPYIYCFGLLCIILVLILIVRSLPNATKAAKWIGWIAIVFVGLLVGLLIFTVTSIPLTSHIEITKSEIRVSSPLYSTSADISNIDLNNVRIVTDLSDGRALVQRSNGLSVGGVKIGWFKLNEGSTAFLFVTRDHDYLIIPTKDKVLILTPKDPQQVLRKMKSFVK